MKLFWTPQSRSLRHIWLMIDEYAERCVAREAFQHLSAISGD